MPKHITRRKALAAGVVSTGLLISARKTHEQKITNRMKSGAQTSHPPFLSPWSPPPDVKRDLAPGDMSVRLASWSSTTTLNYNKDISITDMVKRIRANGYTSANCSVGMFTRNPWLDVSESEIKELKDALQDYDVTFFDMHAYANNIHPDLSVRQKINRHVVEQCEAAERVGCPMVTTHTGNCSTGKAIAPHRDNWTLETWKLSVNVIRQILKDTAGMKVSLGIEALNMININNPRAHLELIMDVGDPRCKVCLDPTNMINLGTYYRTTELINECFDFLGETIIAAHAKDTYLLPDKMSACLTQVLPGRGEMDYALYLARLSRLSYTRTLLIEHLTDEQYPAAKKFIENAAEKGGVTIYW